MTNAEYERYGAELERLLSKVPLEFRAFVSFKAYELGHANGDESILWHTRDLVEDLIEVIEKYTRRIQPGGNDNG